MGKGDARFASPHRFQGCCFRTFSGRNNHIVGANGSAAAPGEKRDGTPTCWHPVPCCSRDIGAVTVCFLLCVGSLPQHAVPGAIAIVMGFHQMGVKLYNTRNRNGEDFSWLSLGEITTAAALIKNNICTKLNTGFSAHTYKERQLNFLKREADVCFMAKTADSCFFFFSSEIYRKNIEVKQVWVLISPPQMWWRTS